MKTTTCNPGARRARSRRRRGNNFVFPQFENILNELMHTNVGDIVTQKNINYTTPAVNVQETEDKFIFEMALPGLTKEDVKINIENDLLTITSAKEMDNETKFRLREFNYGKFERKFRLSDKIDQEKIDAAFNSGVLTITFSKKEEQAPKSIQIK